MMGSEARGEAELGRTDALLTNMHFAKGVLTKGKLSLKYLV